MAIEDYIDFYYDPDWDEGVTCKFCGACGLTWVHSPKLDRWYLYNEDDSLHNCQRLSADPDTLFEDLGEPK